MAAVDAISDSTDWLDTPVSSLGAVEAGLRCHICKDFFDAPVITACSHTFCSACIRRSLSAYNAQRKCPLCWSPFDERQLRKNTVVEELVRLFQEARPKILELGRTVSEAESAGRAESNRRKRKFEASQDTNSNPSPRKTRSQRRTVEVQSSLSPEPDEDLLQKDEERDGDFQLDDGLTACPICQKRMPEAQVFPHLDVHQNGDRAETGTQPQKPGLSTLPSRSQTSTPTMKPLPTITYHLLNDTQLRKKLGDLGIPNAGPKQLMVRRHTEWRNLVNANCDASNPKSKRDLLQILKDWEKAQGTVTVNGTARSTKGSSVMEKDFNRDAWSTSHVSDFRGLIAQARAKAKKTAADDGVKPSNDDNIGGMEAKPSLEILASEANTRPTPSSSTPLSPNVGSGEHEESLGGLSSPKENVAAVKS